MQPGRGDIPAVTPVQAGTRFSNPKVSKLATHAQGCIT